jgi:dihydroorotate dehydrogenase
MNKLRHPKQPQFIYDITLPWEEVIAKKPLWKGGFPTLPKQKKYSFLGQKLISPIIIAAGPASGKLWTDFYFKMGYGAVIQKTRRTTPRLANKNPNIAIVKSAVPLTRKAITKGVTASLDQKDWSEYQSITNSFGNASKPLADWAIELRIQTKAVGEGQLLGCSVTATFLEEPNSKKYLKTTSPEALIVETALDLLMGAAAAVTNGAEFIEFNLACPNVTENNSEGEMFQDPKLVAYTLAEFKRRFPSVPVGFKFGLYKSKAQMKQVFSACGDNLDFVSGVNAIATPVRGDDGKDILPGRTVSGVCGAVMKDIALEEITWAAEIRSEQGLKYEILGGGGVITPADADEFLAAGADAVQIATIALANPLFASEYQNAKK